MAYRVLILIKRIVIDLLKVYIFVIFYPLKILFFYLLPNNRLYKVFYSIFFRFLFLPLIRVAASFIIFLVIRPLRYVQHHLIFPFLMNSRSFLNELQPRRSLWLTNPSYLYKYILYNRHNKYYKFLNPLSTMDGILDHFIRRLRIISPNWRYINLGYYHKHHPTYESDLYRSALYILLNDAIQVKQLESFKYTLHNFSLLYQYIYANLKLDSLRYFYQLKYSLLYSSNNVTKFDKGMYIKRLIYFLLTHIPVLNKIIFSFLFNAMRSCVFFLRFPICFALNNRVLSLYYDLNALMDVPSQRSIHYSNIFGFTGNLFLEYSDFLNVWNMNLLKDTEMIFNRFQYMLDFPYDSWYRQHKDKSSNRVGDWSSNMNSKEVIHQFGVLLGLFASYYDRFEDTLENSNYTELYTTHAWYKNNKYIKTKSIVKEKLDIPNSRYNDDNINHVFPGYNPENELLNPIEDIDTGIAHLSNNIQGIAPRYSSNSYSKYTLSKTNLKFLIKKDILEEYNKRFKLYYNVYRVLGAITYYLMLFLNSIPFMYTKKLKIRENKRTLSTLHHYNLLSGPLLSFFFFILFIESFFLVYYINILN